MRDTNKVQRKLHVIEDYEASKPSFIPRKAGETSPAAEPPAAEDQEAAQQAAEIRKINTAKAYLNKQIERFYTWASPQDGRTYVTGVLKDTVPKSDIYRSNQEIAQALLDRYSNTGVYPDFLRRTKEGVNQKIELIKVDIKGRLTFRIPTDEPANARPITVTSLPKRQNPIETMSEQDETDYDTDELEAF